MSLLDGREMREWRRTHKDFPYLFIHSLSPRITVIGVMVWCIYTRRPEQCHLILLLLISHWNSFSMYPFRFSGSTQLCACDSKTKRDHCLASRCGCALMAWSNGSKRNRPCLKLRTDIIQYDFADEHTITFSRIFSSVAAFRTWTTSGLISTQRRFYPNSCYYYSSSGLDEMSLVWYERSWCVTKT